MRIAIGWVALAAVLGGCATLPPTENTPYLPPGVYGVYQDNDIGAINLASWAFASPANTKGNPIDAARAVIALEYLPGELSENPRWISMDDMVKHRLRSARSSMRQILGIRPDAPPQLVVNAMLALSGALLAGDEAGASQVLASGVFTLPPAQTLQILSNLPFVPDANLATSEARVRTFQGEAMLR